MRPTTSSVLYFPLDEILRSPALVRVLRVLAGHGGSLGVPDIADRARLTLPSVRSAARSLTELEVVTGVRAGRSMVCALRAEHPLNGALVALFAAERQQAEVALRVVRTAAMALRPAPLAVWLYGSVARGQDLPQSDIDVAIVSAKAQPTAQAEALREAITKKLPERAHRISVVALGPADVRRLSRAGTRFWRELERDAIVLAGEAPAGIRERFAGKKAIA